MTAAVRANLWVCATTVERDAMGSEDGLRLGDLAMVQGQGLYRTSTVTASSSTWQVLAGLPVQGVWAMGGRNHTAGPGQARVYLRAAIAFHTPLLVAPSTVTLFAGTNSGWATTPTVVYREANGFVLEGDSDLINSGATAWAYGTFTANP